MSGVRTTTASAIRIPGFIDYVCNKKSDIVRVYLPPDANPAVRDRPLPAQLEPHQRDRRRQAARAAMARHGRGDQALHRRHRHLGMGEQRPRQRARRGDGLRRRRADARNPGRRRSASPPYPGSQDPGGQRGRPDDAAAARGTSARPDRPRFRCAVHHRQAGDLRPSRLSLADPPPDLSAHQPPQHPCARLQGRGHHDHAVRHGGAQRSRPLPSRRQTSSTGCRSSATSPPTPSRRCATS